MNNLNAARMLLLTPAVVSAVGCSVKEEAKKPLNVIYIMSDDHTAHSIGA